MRAADDVQADKHAVHWKETSVTMRRLFITEDGASAMILKTPCAISSLLCLTHAISLPFQFPTDRFLLRTCLAVHNSF